MVHSFGRGLNKDGVKPPKKQATENVNLHALNTIPVARQINNNSNESTLLLIVAGQFRRKRLQQQPTCLNSPPGQCFPARVMKSHHFSGLRFAPLYMSSKTNVYKSV